MVRPWVIMITGYFNEHCAMHLLEWISYYLCIVPVLIPNKRNHLKIIYLEFLNPIEFIVLNGSWVIGAWTQSSISLSWIATNWILNIFPTLLHICFLSSCHLSMHYIGMQYWLSKHLFLSWAQWTDTWFSFHRVFFSIRILILGTPALESSNKWVFLFDF